MEFFCFKLFEDCFSYGGTGEEDVERHLVSGRHLVTVSKPHLVVVRVEGPDPILRSVVKDGVDIEVGA